MPLSQNERETRLPGGSPGPSTRREIRTRDSPAPRDGANTNRRARVQRDLTRWTYNERMELIHHPQGCEMCTNYGAHVSSAEMSADTEYADARERRTMHIQEDAYWRRQADNFDRQLSDAEEEIHRLQRKIDKLEQQLEDTASYDGGRAGKRPRHKHSFESSNGPDRNATPASWTSLVPDSRAPTSYAQTVTTNPAEQQDVHMSGPEEASYPPLPPSAPSMATPSTLSTITRGAQWTPAPTPRPNPRLTGRIISPTNEAELTELIRRAHEEKHMGAVLSMRIFARDAHAAGANRSPLQSMGLTRWRLPEWVPSDQRSPWSAARPADSSRMEMPRQDAPVEEWARWLWRYPQNLVSKPGIVHDPSGISLASIRGYLLVTGRAPRGEGHQRGRAVFILRAIELALTPGLYRRTLASLGITVAVGRSMDRYTNPTENTSVNDVVRFYAQQGISIDEVVDAHVWAERQLRHFSQDNDVARRAEALQVMQRIRQYTNAEAQDELRVLAPAWWEATTPPQPMARPVVIPPPMVTENATRPRRGSAFIHSSSRTSTLDYYPATEESAVPYPSVAGPGPAGFADGGWTGHVRPPKKKKARKPKGSAPKKEDTPSSSLPSATRPKRNLAYYGITLRPTEGEVLDDLPPILTDSDESSDDDFAEEVNQTFLNRTAVLANATSGADQVLVMTEPAEAQPAPDENPASPKVTPTDTTMEE
jgi:hypothetical protein